MAESLLPLTDDTAESLLPLTEDTAESLQKTYFLPPSTNDK